MVNFTLQRQTLKLYPSSFTAVAFTELVIVQAFYSIILYMEIQAPNRPYFDPYDLSIKQINSLDIIEATYIVASSLLLTDSHQHLSSTHSYSQLFELTPLKKQHQSVPHDPRFGKYQEQKHPLEVSYTLDLTRPSPPSIENIMMQNQRKEQIDHITARFVNKIEDIFNDYPQFCSLQINTSSLTHHNHDGPSIPSNTSLGNKQPTVSPKFYQPQGSFKLIESQREQRSGSGQETKWSDTAEGEDHTFMEREHLMVRLKAEKDKSFKLQQVLKFVSTRTSSRMAESKDVDRQILSIFLRSLQKG